MKLDHLTVVAKSLAEGAEHIRATLGIEMPSGGSHPQMGTHNRLMALGPDSFLELIAIDPEASPPSSPRWFGLDQFDGPPRLATWVLGVPDLAMEIARAPRRAGRATPITRGKLNWLISVPEDGGLPLGGAWPTLIEWPDGPHPAATMTDLGCRLIRLSVNHPRVHEIRSHFGREIQGAQLELREAPCPRLEAEIATPLGLRLLA